VVARHPEGRRTVAWVEMFSPPLRGFFIAPAESWLWGGRQAAARATLSFPGEMTLLPGFVLIGLAFAGLFFSAWRLRHRLLLAAGVLVSVALAGGTEFGSGGVPGYATLIRYVPGWDALRTSGRLVLWTTLLLGILAAGALSAVRSRTGIAGRGHLGPLAGGTGALSPTVRSLTRLAALVPLALVIIEGINVTPHAAVPPEPAAMRGATGPLLVLPSDGIRELHVMLWSTDGFPRIVNGLASFTPASQAETRAITATFPDAQSVAYLRNLGIRTVILLPGEAAGTPWQEAANRPVAGLGIGREEIDGAVVFRIG
jgi:hypothetical protein